MTPNNSYWVPVNLYPDDAKLRVLLVAERRTDGATVPQIGCRQQGKWYLKTMIGAGSVLVELDPYWMVTGWQPIQYEADSTVTDEQLRESFKRSVRVSANGSVYIGDVIGWFRKNSAQLVAERVYLRAMVEK